MTKPVVIEYTKATGDYGKGERFVVSSAAAARSVHPDAKILSYESGEPLKETKAEAPRDAEAAPDAKPEVTKPDAEPAKAKKG